MVGMKEVRVPMWIRSRYGLTYTDSAPFRRYETLRPSPATNAEGANPERQSRPKQTKQQKSLNEGPRYGALFVQASMLVSLIGLTCTVSGHRNLGSLPGYTISHSERMGIFDFIIKQPLISVRAL